MDVGINPGDDWILARPERRYFEGWREGDRLYGQAVVNDKGPMAAFMVAGASGRGDGRGALEAVAREVVRS